MVAVTLVRRSLLILTGMGALTLAVLTMAPDTALELKAQGLGPVLPLATSSFDLPGLSDALRDPSLVKRRPEDDGDANRLASEIKELRSDLSRAAGERAAELNEQTYQDYAILAYYFEDIASGRLAGDKGKASANLQTVRGLLAQYATAAERTSKDARVKARAEFHLYAAQYLSGQNRGKAIQGLKDLAKASLDQNLKNRAAMMVALGQLDSGSAADKAKAQASLKNLAASLPAAAQVAVRLDLGRSLAGLSRAGKKVQATNPAYRGQLAAASQKASSLAPADKERALNYTIAVWRQGEGRAMQWSKVPFRMSAYGQSLTVKAIVERAALEDWAQNRRPQAIRKYESLAKSLTGNATRAELDLRALEMQRGVYATAKDPKPFERALVNAEKTYLDTGLLGDGNEAKVKTVRAEILRRHKGLVYGEMARVATAQASTGERKRAIGMAQNYLRSTDDLAEVETVKGKIANLYVLSNMHSEAVGLYKELAETSKSDKVPQYWGLAIKSQSVLAAWPSDVPWQGVKGGKEAEREELLNLYKKLAETSPNKADWFVAAQTGLLDIQLGRGDAAFAAWREKLAKDSNGSHAANAAGYMMIAYQKAGAWGDVEALARLALGHKMQPLYRNAPVVANDMLALALLEGGKKSLEAGEFPVAVLKLKEFVAQHQDAKRHDEGFFLLSSAYRGAGQHSEAIKTLLAFADRYPRSTYARTAMLNGGDWSAPMAFEDNAMFFYNRFLTGFSGDAEAPRVRESLTALYMGRELYAEALGILNSVVRNPSTPGEQKALAVAEIMDIEERHGSMQRASLAADLLIKGKSVNEAMKANAYPLKARMAQSGGRSAEVRGIEATLSSLGSSQETQEAIGEARYLMAVNQAKGIAKKYYNLELTNPEGILAQRYEAFKQARAAYQHVCEGGISSFCAPAMVKLTQMSMNFVKSIEDIMVQETLARNLVAHFNGYKQSVYNDVSKTSERADAKATASLKEGATDPYWTEAVLWQNTADWNFDRVSGETGNGYVQWSVSDPKAAE